MGLEERVASFAPLLRRLPTVGGGRVASSAVGAWAKGGLDLLALLAVLKEEGETAAEETLLSAMDAPEEEEEGEEDERMPVVKAALEVLKEW